MTTVTNFAKNLGFAIVTAVVFTAPVVAFAADLSTGHYADTSYTTSPSNSSGHYADTSYSTSGSGKKVTTGHYADTSYTTTSSIGHYADTSYTTSYTTPTYTTYTYTTGGGCSGNCGGYVQPTCSLNVSNNTITRGQAVTVSWGSTNASYANITNLGSNLSASGSYVLYPQNDTTYTGTFYGQNGQTVTCSKTVTVTYQAPSCTITGPDSATPGQTITLNWNSSNTSYGNIDNLGTNLPSSGSHSFTINNTTTFYGTFYGQNGQTTNCQKTVTVNQNNNLSCTISINNYGNGYNNGYWQPNSAVTLSWNSSGASSGYINNGFGNVGLSGSRTIYPTQTTTYTGTFYNYQGQQVTCSATVYVGGYVPPVNPGTPFVTLSQVPYTGLDLGPVGTVLYWGFIAFWCALAAYLIVIKKVHNQVYASLTSILFGSSAAHAAPAGHAPVSYAAPAAHTHAAAAPADTTDPFIASQLNRVR